MREQYELQRCITQRWCLSSSSSSFSSLLAGIYSLLDRENRITIDPKDLFGKHHFWHIPGKWGNRKGVSERASEQPNDENQINGLPNSEALVYFHTKFNLIVNVMHGEKGPRYRQSNIFCNIQYTRIGIIITCDGYGSGTVATANTSKNGNLSIRQNRYLALRPHSLL